MPSTACPSCGALNPASASRCVLCGSDLAPSAEIVADDPLWICPACGHANPAGARFCNRCGTLLHGPPDEGEAEAPARPPAYAAERPSSAPAWRGVAFVGGALALVALLYGATLVSGRSGAAPAETAAEAAAAGTAAGPGAAIPDGPAPPLRDARLQATADSLGARGTADGHFEEGRIYLTAGFEAQQAGDAAGVLWVRRAIDAFERSLALDDRADTRFALAEAAQFDPADPMRPTVEAQALLEREPAHVGGNFLMGQLRMTIGRVDSARASFERVLVLAPPSDPFHRRAREMIGLLDVAAGGGAAGGGAAGGAVTGRP